MLKNTFVNKDIWTKSQSEILNILGFTTLEDRGTRGDLIKMLKIIKGLDKVE